MALMDEANEFDPTQDLEAFQAEREEETRAHRGEVLDRFKSARRKAVGHLHLVATKVAATQEDDVAGTELAAEFYEHVANGLSRSDVASMFSVQTGANQAQVIELEAVRGQLNTAEQELDRSNQTNEQLRRSALEASNLQAQLTTTQNTLTAKEEELRLANEEVNRLKREADKPNPLKGENDRLVRENSRLTTDAQALQTELNDEKEAHAATKHELEQLQQQLTTAPPVVTPPPTPVAKPEPAAASSDESGETSHTMTHAEAAQTRRQHSARGRGIVGTVRAVSDRAKSIAPGHSNPTNTPKDGEK